MSAVEVAGHALSQRLLVTRCGGVIILGRYVQLDTRPVPIATVEDRAIVQDNRLTLPVLFDVGA